MRRIMGVETICATHWETSRGPCFIQHSFSSDSGEYWCEAKGGGRSNAVNITVTAGPVILESPALPVMEGDAVTLRCRSKMTSSSLKADFYKDDLPIGTSSTREMTIHGVSKSDEGLYKCSISEFVESPESWVTIKADHRLETRSSSDHSCHIYLILRTVFTILMVALLLLLVGLLHCGKVRVTQK
ncbi:Fc receptor-like A [Sebastes fasciatus]|uniref:Fc receptor-like A n=1 Tax=Sebastes fasciatus TaxID=394691 RepID=UPI003D9E8BE1